MSDGDCIFADQDFTTRSNSSYRLCTRGNDTTLRGATFTHRQVALFILRRRFQPTFDIEDNPFLLRVLLHRSHHQVMAEIVLTRLTWLHYTHPLRSVRFHGLPRYYGVLRPLVSLPYSR